MNNQAGKLLPSYNLIFRGKVILFSIFMHCVHLKVGGWVGVLEYKCSDKMLVCNFCFIISVVDTQPTSWCV